MGTKVSVGTLSLGEADVQAILQEIAALAGDPSIAEGEAATKGPLESRLDHAKTAMVRILNDPSANVDFSAASDSLIDWIGQSGVVDEEPPEEAVEVVENEEEAVEAEADTDDEEDTDAALSEDSLAEDAEAMEEAEGSDSGLPEEEGEDLAVADSPAAGDGPPAVSAGPVEGDSPQSTTTGDAVDPKPVSVVSLSAEQSLSGLLRGLADLSDSILHGGTVLVVGSPEAVKGLLGVEVPAPEPAKADSGQAAEPPAVTAMKQRLKQGGDLGNTEARIQFVKEHDIKTRKSPEETSYNGLRSAILRYAELNG